MLSQEKNEYFFHAQERYFFPGSRGYLTYDSLQIRAVPEFVRVQFV